MKIKVTVTSVKSGKNKNWLTFSAFIDSLSKNTLYSFDFCGTEIIHSLSLRQKAIDDLCSMLCSDFGYAPYDIKKCRKICGKGKEYFIIAPHKNKLTLDKGSIIEVGDDKNAKYRSTRVNGKGI